MNYHWQRWLAVLSIALLLGVAIVIAPAIIGVSSATEGNCQYPDRLNANGSCDNSDPCDPATLKESGLQGDCQDTGSTNEKDQTLPDPDRPYYDAEGNKYDAWGNLIETAPQQDTAPSDSVSSCEAAGK